MSGLRAPHAGGDRDVMAVAMPSGENGMLMPQASHPRHGRLSGRTAPTP